MIINLARIDDRLIHGQVATVWTKEAKVNRIIVVNDEVANDQMRKTLLTQVAPPGVKASVVDIDKAVRVYNSPKYVKDKVMLLFTNPADVIRVIEAGIKLTTVNIGGLAFKEGKTMITNAVSVNEEDVAAFRKLDEMGIELEVRKVAADSKVKIIPLLDKLEKEQLKKK